MKVTLTNLGWSRSVPPGGLSGTFAACLVPTPAVPVLGHQDLHEFITEEYRLTPVETKDWCPHVLRKYIINDEVIWIANGDRVSVTTLAS